MQEGQMNNDTVRLTGAWTRGGKFGDFYVGRFSLTELNEALSKLNNPEQVEIIVTAVKEKKSEQSPDYNINLRLPLPKGEKSVGSKPAVGGTGFGGAVKSAAKSYGNKRA